MALVKEALAGAWRSFPGNQCRVRAPTEFESEMPETDAKEILEAVGMLNM